MKTVKLTLSGQHMKCDFFFPTIPTPEERVLSLDGAVCHEIRERIDISPFPRHTQRRLTDYPQTATLAYKLARGRTPDGYGHDQQALVEPVLPQAKRRRREQELSDTLLEKLHHLAARCPRVAGLLLGSAHLAEAKRRQRARRILGAPSPSLL